MLLDTFGSHILGYLFLPMFTLIPKKNDTVEEDKKKSKKNIKLAEYDADMDDLDSSDIGEDEKKKLKE